MLRHHIFIFFLLCLLKTYGQTQKIKVAKEKTDTFDIADFYGLIGKDSTGVITQLMTKYSNYGHYFINPKQCEDAGIGLLDYLPKDDELYFGFCIDRFNRISIIGIFIHGKSKIDNTFIKKQLKDKKFSLDAGRREYENILYTPYRQKDLKINIVISTKKDKLLDIKIR